MLREIVHAPRSFSKQIDASKPWKIVVAEINPLYLRGKACGRPPLGVQQMPRMYTAQRCFRVPDEGFQKAVYNCQAIQGFIEISPNRETAPDTPTLLKFRRLLGANKLTGQVLTAINTPLAPHRLLLKEGSRGCYDY